MSVEELRANIDIILAQADRRAYYDVSGIASRRRAAATSWVRVEPENPEARISDEDQPYIARPGEAVLVNERVEALRLLYAQASPDEQAAFPSLLQRKLHQSNGRTFAHVAVEIGILPGVASAWLVAQGSLLARQQLWVGLTEKMTMESHLFRDAAISELLEVMITSRPALARLGLSTQVDTFGVAAQKVQFLRLSQRLKEGHNPEINADKQELVSRMAQLGFQAEIATTLQELEGKVLGATTPLDFKNCMETMRTVYEEIVEDAAKTVASIMNVTYAPPKSDFWPWNKLLMETGILNADEGELTQKLYGCFSNVASHRLGSAPEQLRVTKNMVIELGLLIVGRVQALKATTLSA